LLGKRTSGHQQQLPPERVVKKREVVMRGALIGATIVVFSLLGGGPSTAEPCLLAYPEQSVVFRFDPAKYRLVLPGETLYNPDYDRSGAVLWDREKNRIAYEVYQAPMLEGFAPAVGPEVGFVLHSNTIDLVIDGFSRHPQQIGGIYVRFFPVPYQANPRIVIDGVELRDFYYPIAFLTVDQPTGNGFYTGTVVLKVTWSGAEAIRITVFRDKNGNRAFEGEPCYDVYLKSQGIPTAKQSWGSIKALYH